MPTETKPTRHVVVTGADVNIGAAIAHHLASAGWGLVVHGRTAAEAETALGLLLTRVPGAVAIETSCDLASPAEIDAAWARLDDRGVVVDAVVNNAADQAIQNDGFLDPELFESVFAVNVFGALRVARHCAQRLIAGELPGAIVNISSLAGQRGIPGRPAYSSSKAALDGITRGMALELAGHGITVNPIAAGYVHNGRWADLSDESLDRRRKNIPVGVPTFPDEIAHLAELLISRRLPSMTGSTLVIDGGLSVQQVPADTVR